jgi:hypothetical protein
MIARAVMETARYQRFQLCFAVRQRMFGKIPPQEEFFVPLPDYEIVLENFWQNRYSAGRCYCVLRS